MRQRTFILILLIIIFGLVLVAFQFLGRDNSEVQSKFQQRLLDTGKVFERNGDLNNAEQIYLQVLEEFPNETAALQRLALLKFSESLAHEARNYAVQSLAQNDVNYSCLLIASGITSFPAERIEDISSTYPPLLRQARRMIRLKKFDYAVDLLKKIVSEHPNNLKAQGLLGQALAWERSSEFATWNAALPDSANAHPEIWFARGIAAHQNQDLELAVACFLETLKSNPIHFETAHQLQTVLPLSKLRGRSASLSKYVKAIIQIDVLLHDLAFTQDVRMMERIAQEFIRIKQPLLANAWARMAAQLGCEDKWIAEVLQSSNHADELTYPVDEIRNQFGIEEIERRLATVTWNNFTFSNPESNEFIAESSIQFRDVADEIGLKFQFENGSLPNLQLGHLFETTGGGVGVIDFDSDGWPDLYFAQGGDWRNETSSLQQSNKLVRNLQGGSAQEITNLAGLESFEYSHGICIGDYNSDGFADLYVCQLRGNRLYENQGDGTFFDVTDESKTIGNEWSLSAAFADLNNDGLSDLYVVNYLDRTEAEKSPCYTKGSPRACPPKMFAGVQDKFYLNAGDGTFLDVSHPSGIGEYTGKGMGIVAADFDEDGLIELFVGNDGEENFFFQSSANNRSRLPLFEQDAMLLGVATTGRGEKQATMGIAAGDLNDDGRLDLLTTNFYQEPMTFYAQSSVGNFADQTARAGRIIHESEEMLGFGVQLLDPDLDGDLDAVVANGHVDRSSVTGEPDGMLPQLFINTGEASFLQSNPATTGEYFQKRTLGRAVAKLDWNRDGHQDLCFTHIDAPVALLLNETNSGNKYLCLKMIAVEGDRSAIGTTVKIRCGDKTWSQQVTSGDGYLVSNEKQLVFGLGKSKTIDEIQIKWNSGKVNSFKNLESNKKFYCIENRENLVPFE